MRRPAWVTPWSRARRVLGLNGRNLLYVHALNRRRHFPLADDKQRAKQRLAAAGVPIPETLAVLSTLVEVSRSRSRLEQAREFVIKPVRGSRGCGILVISDHEDGLFQASSGARLTWESLRAAMGDILFGVHSVGQADQVLIEKRVLAHPGLGDLAGQGLPDVRVILLHGRPAMAMMRVPTRASGGRANLHQGALGVALGLSSGRARRCALRGRPVDRHPDSGIPLTGFQVPLWEEILDVARRAASCMPLAYIGVDVVLEASQGPVVMEVNARPGLEIQNVNGAGLRRRLERIAARGEGAPP